MCGRNFPESKRPVSRLLLIVVYAYYHAYLFWWHLPSYLRLTQTNWQGIIDESLLWLKISYDCVITLLNDLDFQPIINNLIWANWLQFKIESDWSCLVILLIPAGWKTISSRKLIFVFEKVGGTIFFERQRITCYANIFAVLCTALWCLARCLLLVIEFASIVINGTSYITDGVSEVFWEGLPGVIEMLAQFV